MRRKKRRHPHLKSKWDDDPIERLNEWQERRYDPGYYTGGKIHPLFAASRPNRYGYVLIVCGILTLIMLIFGIRAGAMDWYAVTVMASFMVFCLVVGFLMLKKPVANGPRAKRGGSKVDH